MSEVFQNEDHLKVLTDKIVVFKKRLSSSTARQLTSKVLKTGAKNLVQQYFRITRTELIQMSIDSTNFDLLMQNLNELVSKNSLTSTCRTLIKLIEKEIPKMEIKRELFISEKQISSKEKKTHTTEIDKRILATLSDTIPSAALSYKQALMDLDDNSKISFRGTAAELREVIREVLDYLAPDKDVKNSEGFVYEKDSKGNFLPSPTMKQKTRYILKSRGLSKTAIKTPESVLNIIEESIGVFTRSTYERGSISTHQTTEEPDIRQLKSYAETLLCELLEIYKQE